MWYDLNAKHAWRHLFSEICRVDQHEKRKDNARLLIEKPWNASMVM
jgi:hypothetical protein